MFSRRSFLTGLIAAPAVIRVAPLMRIAPAPIYGVSPLMQAMRALRDVNFLEAINLQELQRHYEHALLYGSSTAMVGNFEGLIRLENG